MSVIWHDLECGSYSEDLPLWRALAAEHGDPVLDIGCGTGRVALDLGRAGHRVTAVDREPALIDELRRRARGLQVVGVVADAREFTLRDRVPLCIVPMQTIQLLGGSDGRSAFLGCARRHVESGGILAIAIAEMLEVYDVQDGAAEPLPDIVDINGAVYASRATAVKLEPGSFILERLRETTTTEGVHSEEHNVVRLDRISVERMEREAVSEGFVPAGTETINATPEYAGSTVVMLRG